MPDAASYRIHHFYSRQSLVSLTESFPQWNALNRVTLIGDTYNDTIQYVTSGLCSRFLRSLRHVRGKFGDFANGATKKLCQSLLVEKKEQNFDEPTTQVREFSAEHELEQKVQGRRPPGQRRPRSPKHRWSHCYAADRPCAHGITSALVTQTKFSSEEEKLVHFIVQKLCCRRSWQTEGKADAIFRSVLPHPQCFGITARSSLGKAKGTLRLFSLAQ